MKNKIRFIIALFFLISIIIYTNRGFFYNNKTPKENSSSKIKNFKQKEHFDFSLIQHLTDKNDSLDVAYRNHASKVCNYSKIPFSELTIDEFNKSTQILESIKVLSVKNTLKLNNSAIKKILDFVANGGTLVIPGFSEDARMAYFYGLKTENTFEIDIKTKGIFFKTDFLPLVKGKRIQKSLTHYSLAKENFSNTIKVLVSADSDKEFPVVIENNIGKGKVIYFNTGYELEKADRGLIFSSFLKGLEGIPYPVANVSTIFLDDFISPLYSTKLEPIKSEMDLSIIDFVTGPWWDDMQKMADELSIKYTAITVFDYRGVDKPPFLFGQWNSAFKKFKGKKVNASDWMCEELLKEGHEMGFHGYNHISLLNSDWAKPEYMAISLNAVKKKWLISNLGKLPTSYVPPSNYIDSIGMNQLASAMPSLKYMCSLYLGDYEDGGAREFDKEKWSSNFFNFPRISSGFIIEEEDQYNLQSLYLYSGIWTHFVHPDDVYQTKANANETAGHFSLRNKYNLGWRKSNNKLFKNKGLFHVFKDYIIKQSNAYPLSRYVGATEGGNITKNWRNSNYKYKITNNFCEVSSQNNTNDENYWFLYVSNQKLPKIEQELAKKIQKFSKTPYLDGYLYAIKTKLPKLKISHNFHESNSKDQNTEQLLTNTVLEYQNFNKKEEDTYANRVLPKLNSQQDSIKYYIANNELKKATDILEKKLYKERVVDTLYWNQYYKYMAWQKNESGFWSVLDSYTDKNPFKENLKYSRQVGLKNGYLNEESRKKWLKKQLLILQDKELLKEYIATFNNKSNSDTITSLLNKLRKIEPNVENERKYILHLITYKPQKAIEELNTKHPSNANCLHGIATEISWLYADNKKYKKAYDWSKYSKKIKIVNKLYWLYEAKDYETLEEEYNKHIAKNPSDEQTKLLMGELFLGTNQVKKAWAIGSELPNSIKRDTLFKRLNKNVIYETRDTQKFLLKKYPNLFEQKVKDKLEKEIRLAENNYIEAIGSVSGDNVNTNFFKRKLLYTIKSKKENSHTVYISNADVFSLQKTMITDNDNIDKQLYGLGYRFDKLNFKNKYNFWGTIGLEKDEQNNIFYMTEIGAAINSLKKYSSLTFKFNPVQTGVAYQKKIYRNQLSFYQENKIANKFKTILFIEGNYYTNDALEGSITSRFSFDNSKDVRFKIIPELEISYTKTNADQIIDYPYYLVKQRFYYGPQIGLRYGKQLSKFNTKLYVGRFFDNDLGNFNRVTGSAFLRIYNFTDIKLMFEFSNQPQAFSNSFNLGVRYVF